MKNLLNPQKFSACLLITGAVFRISFLNLNMLVDHCTAQCTSKFISTLLLRNEQIMNLH